MLEELWLKSVGGVDQARLHFSPGLTVITGESGAGKSSLVRALELISGKRAQSAVIRGGDEEASVEAFFLVAGLFSDVEEVFQPQEGSFCVRRELSRTGRGKAFIQGTPVPLNRIAEMTSGLISIQSQFAQLELLSTEQQLRIMDGCGGVELLETRRKLEELFYSIISDERDLRQIRQREQQILESYGQADELAQFLNRSSLVPESESLLSKEYAQTDEALRRCRELRHRFRLLQDPETGGLIRDIRGLLEGLSDLLPQEYRETVEEKSEKLCDFLDELAELLGNAAPKEYLSELEAELERIESLLGRIRKFKRMVGVESLAGLFEFSGKAEVELQWLESSKERQQQLSLRIAETRREAAREAKRLRELRLEAAEELQKTVTAHLADLAMERSRFIVKITESNKLRASGAEQVEFLLERGDNMPLPVAKAASGGELSRILLALQLSLPAELMPSTVVFDEVEAGLGGRAAYLTGLKLRLLADKIQVLLITHEATIAAMGDQHYLVERKGALSSIRKLEKEERIQELARMLSGDPSSEKALSHAQQLLDRGNSGEDLFAVDEASKNN